MYVPRQKHLDIDGAYFGLSFPNVLFKTYPDLYPKEGPLTYIPTIYGFKIFGQKGSAYEYKYDNNGQPLNKKEIEAIENEKVTAISNEKKEEKHDDKVKKNFNFNKSSQKFQAAVTNQL